MRITKTKVNFSKYKGKEVAIVKGKIVASGSSSKSAFEAAKKLFPKIASRDIILLSVPKERFAIYILLKK
ncbi:MAG: DUF5678 domain-containing protein [Candidatus Pacebacteria bacterium]|nr:DUF5678 domain-containing protein [Candidatus Paceibacterota bacterium]